MSESNYNHENQLHKDVVYADWFADESQITHEQRDFVQKYTGLDSEKVVPHILDIRDRAWKVWGYPCIGGFRFIEAGIASVPRYQEVLEKLKQGQTLLDMGTCVGQDVRKLVSDGAPAENIYGTDLEGAFIDLGYDLFKDRGKLKATFIAADILDPSSDSELKKLDGKIDVVWAGSFFHLFCWDEQVAAAKRLVKLVRPQAGSMVLGRQMGNVVPREIPDPDFTDKTMYRHNAASFARMWEEVGKATGTEWDVVEFESSPVKPIRNEESQDSGTRRCRFTVLRV